MTPIRVLLVDDEKEFTEVLAERLGTRDMLVEVADNGPGIRDRSIEGCSTHLEGSARKKGKGFGLFIAREVLQGHGGLLEVRSEQGVGTTVRLYFPVDGKGEV